MKNPINNLIVATLPIIPKAIVRLFAKRYVAGITAEEAISTAIQLNARGFDTTLDILGEHVQTADEADLIARQYADLYYEIDKRGANANISVKPTHLGLDLGIDICRRHIFTILEAAKKTNNFLRIDMEDSPHTDQTLELFRTSCDRYGNVGTVLQAYLYRSSTDLAALMDNQINFRLCKGIYRESPDIAIQEHAAINDNFLALIRQALEGDAYVAIATHDLALIPRVEELIGQMNISTERFEFQALHGVPMEGKLDELLAKGFKVRIYIPFGEAWYDYSVRRLKENPNIAGNVLKNLLRQFKS